MSRPSASGFTLLEAAIVIAIAGLLAVGIGSAFVNVRRNASATGTAYEVMLRFQGLKTRALQEQRDYAAVFINPANGDASSGCRVGALYSCLRMVVVSAPPTGWTLSGFDTRAPGMVVDDVFFMDRDVVLDLPSAGKAAPAPFSTLTQFPTSMQTTCAAPTPSSGGATGDCYAIRFGADGTVSPVYPGAVPDPPPGGVAIGFTTDPEHKRLRSWRSAVSITFPTGISRSYGYD